MRKKMISVFGEILIDIFPEKGYENIGGAPFNFAFHLQQMLGNVAFLSRIGKDYFSVKVLDYLSKSEFPDQFIQKDSVHPTGQVNVKLSSAGVPQFSIVEEVAYDYIKPDQNILSFENELIYFGSLAQRSTTSRNTLLELLSKNPISLKFFDINLRGNFYSKDILASSLEQTTVLKINEDELVVLKDLFQLTGSEKEMVVQVCKKFEIPTICLTLGDKGSVLYLAGEWFHSELNKVKVVDTVGAGDAFASVLAVGLLCNWPGQSIIDAATAFASTVCTIRGAISLTDGFYDKIISRIKG